MSTIPASPLPAPRPQSVPTGPAGARPAGPAGARPLGGAGSHPGMRRGAPSATQTAAHRRQLTAAFVELFLEVEAGCRPPRHLAPLLSPMLYARLSRVWYRGGQPGRVISVSVLGGGPDAFDAIAVVRRGDRSGAVSLRLVRGPQRWRIEELARPEDGALPGPAHRVALHDDVDDDDAAVPAVGLREPGSAGISCGDGLRNPSAAPAEPGWLLSSPTG